MTLTRRQLFTATRGLAARRRGGTAVPAAFPRAEADERQTPIRRNWRKAGPDGDIVLGSDKAPVTVIEYASMTCPHCAHFSTTTFPELQKRYIDTGKVRFIFREFPLDALAAAGFMLARCAGKDKFMPVVETLFAKQPEWMVKKPIPPLAEIAKQFGFTEQRSTRAWRIRRCSTTSRRCATAPPKARGQFHADFFHQRQEVRRRPVDRRDGQGDRPLSQGRIRVFCRRGLPRPLRPFRPLQSCAKVWITPRRCCACGRDDSFSAPMRHNPDSPIKA